MQYSIQAYLLCIHVIGLNLAYLADISRGGSRILLRGGAPSMDKTLSGKPNIMTTALRLLYSDNIL